MSPRFTLKASAIAALVFAVAACSAEQSTDDDQQWQEIAVVHATSSGQSQELGPVLIENGQQVLAYSVTFGDSAGQIGQDLSDALATAEIPDGWRTLADLVSIGCLAPESIDLQDGQLAATIPDEVVGCEEAHTYVVLIAAAPEVADELLATAER